MSNAERPIVRRFPALAALPRVSLGNFPTSVDRLPTDRPLWIKRDDRNTPRYGGNKIRALEFLLGAAQPGDTVITIGGEGSTHVMVTAAVARRLDLRMRALRWKHDMNPEASLTAGKVRALGAETIRTTGPIQATIKSWILRRHPRTHYIPLGGTTPLGMLGHVNAGLEIGEQVREGVMPEPAELVLPLGTGGTAAGLALGLHLAGLETRIVAVRVGPRFVSAKWAIRWRLHQVRRLLERLTGERIEGPPSNRIVVEHGWSGGAYGRPEPRARRPADWLRETTGVRLDGTYSAKAFGAAWERAENATEPVLFWLTFDGRWIEESGGASGELHITGPQQAVRPHTRTPR